jgi:hypothetical protein
MCVSPRHLIKEISAWWKQCEATERNADAYRSGYGIVKLTGQQYSKAVIDQMAARHTSRPDMTWLEMDIFDLQFGEEFDLVIDKG